MAKHSEKDNTGAVQAKQNPSADDESKVAGNSDQSQNPSADDVAKAEENPAPQKIPRYRITCRNAFSKGIGGVAFVNGVGYTDDGFTASWFSNKEGYEVVKE